MDEDLIGLSKKISALVSREIVVIQEFKCNFKKNTLPQLRESSTVDFGFASPFSYNSTMFDC